MRYPAEHKAQAHARIVEIAAREFREKGLDGIGIADLMSRAGLTHGGFYAHFKDRDALVSEAAVRAAQESLERLADAAQSARQGRELEAMIEFYLSPAHRDDVAYGCLLPALSAEMSRQSAAVRKVFTSCLKTNLARLAQFMPARDASERLVQVTALIGSMAGGVLLARAVDDPKLSGMMLRSVRDQLLSHYRRRRGR